MGQVEFMVRVKLPSSSSFASCPSGDTDYDEAYKGAIFAAKPPGFEVRWPRAGERWPVDSEGYTWVRLFLSDQEMADNGRLMYWIDEANKRGRELLALREKAKLIAGL